MHEWQKVETKKYIYNIYVRQGADYMKGSVKYFNKKKMNVPDLKGNKDFLFLNVSKIKIKEGEDS